MKLARAAALMLALCGMSAQVHAARILHVRGAARIDGHAGRRGGKLLLEGRVLDDAASPVPNVALAISAKSGSSAVDLTNVLSPCGDEHPLAQMKTDESGRYCVLAAVPMGTYSVHLEAGPTQWLAKAAADYSVDLAKRSVQLRFDPEPRILATDGSDVTLDAMATYDDDDSTGTRAGASGLMLVLSTESGAVMTSAATEAGGRALLLVEPRKLGPPGRGALVLRFAGDDTTMASEHVSPIERDAHVTLSLVAPVAPSSPEDGVDIEVAARSSYSGGGTVTGTVEARLEGVLVGAAPLDGTGHAKLRATFVPARGAKGTTLEARYVPDAPWFQPAGDLAVPVPIRGPSPWRQVPLAIGAIAVGAWLLLGRSARRQRLDRTIVMDRPPTHEGTAGISVVQSSRGRTGTYSGRVVDAHDGSPVARARISVQTPSFTGASVLASVFADESGAFSFDLASAPPDAELVVEAPLHAELRQKLPGAGVLEIAVVSRRRRLLERLVQWARRRGPPFDVRPEPTPAQVRRAAEGALPAAAVWADAIEQAAFDQGDVDARVEAEVMALDPDKREPPPRQR